MHFIKNTFIRLAVVAFPLAIGLQSCGDAFFDVNTTPNNPIAVPPTVLLTTVEVV